MAVKVFGEFAIEWARVYAARITKTDFSDLSKPTEVALVANFPFESDEQKKQRKGEGKQGNYVHILHHANAQAAWDLLKSDFIRFAIVGRNDNQTAIDMSRVCLVSVEQGSGKGTVMFDLGGDLYQTITLGPDATEILLACLRKQPA